MTRELGLGLLLTLGACTKPNPVWNLGGDATGSSGPTTGSTAATSLGTSEATTPSSTTSAGAATASSQGATSDATQASMTSGSTEGEAGWLECGELDACTVAYYRFETLPSAVVEDETGQHDGTWAASAGAATDGPAGCGMALAAGDPVAGVIPSHADFDLREGSIDLWIRPSSFAERRAVLARDGDGNGPGHLSLAVGPAILSDGTTMETMHLGVRYQAPDDALTSRRCSEQPLDPDVWVHVGVNFGAGGLELYIDGAPQDFDGAMSIADAAAPCTGAGEPTMVGNDNPWVIGAGSHRSSVGTADMIEQHFIGAIDELRISGCRRTFGVFGG